MDIPKLARKTLVLITLASTFVLICIGVVIGVLGECPAPTMTYKAELSSLETGAAFSETTSDCQRDDSQDYAPWEFNHLGMGKFRWKWLSSGLAGVTI
jgi:hypothetical protein